MQKLSPIKKPATRILFDSLLEMYPTTRNYIDQPPDVDIVPSPNFESGIVKVMKLPMSQYFCPLKKIQLRHEESEVPQKMFR